MKRISYAVLTAMALAWFGAGFPVLAATPYVQTNLVSDLPGVAAFTDPNLKNPWGIDFLSGGPLWISNNGTNTSTVYQGDGKAVSFPPLSPLIVNVPGSPTGVVANNTTGFQLAPGKKAVFIFAGEGGQISAWNPGVDLANAVVKASASGAIYKGITTGTVPVGSVGQVPLLYATNFNSGKVDVFAPDFSPVGSFTDSTIPAGFAPFNVQNLGGKLYVTYAKQDAGKEDDVAGAGNGFVDVFNPDGTFVKRFASNGPLNSPWGVAMAPAGFGEFSNDLLIGNFGDGKINAYDPVTGAFLGQLQDANGAISIAGLWGLKFGSGGLNGDPNTLFFTAGIPDTPGGPLEEHGLFGSISAVPEPGSWLLMLGGLGMLGLVRFRRYTRN